jgi:GMP synthase-like glutamine amidotransferase
LVADVERDVPNAVAHRRAEEDLIRPPHALTVEAVELPDEPVVGVQWHPEVLWHDCAHAMDLLRGFTAECARTRWADPIAANGTRTDR